MSRSHVNGESHHILCHYVISYCFLEGIINHKATRVSTMIIITRCSVRVMMIMISVVTSLLSYVLFVQLPCCHTRTVYIIHMIQTSVPRPVGRAWNSRHPPSPGDIVLVP